MQSADTPRPTPTPPEPPFEWEFQLCDASILLSVGTLAKECVRSVCRSRRSAPSLRARLPCPRNFLATQVAEAKDVPVSVKPKNTGSRPAVGEELRESSRRKVGVSASQFSSPCWQTLWELWVVNVCVCAARLSEIVRIISERKGFCAWRKESGPQPASGWIWSSWLILSLSLFKVVFVFLL